MSYLVLYDTQPRKYLEKLNKTEARRIIEKIESILSLHPIPRDAKPIVGEHGAFRIRIGDFRALYRVEFQNGKVIIFKIDKRSRIY